MSVPKNGTRAAVDYWAVRARDDLQQARFWAGLNDRRYCDWDKAMDFAEDAAGSAGEFQIALAAYREKVQT